MGDRDRDRVPLSKAQTSATSSSRRSFPKQTVKNSSSPSFSVQGKAGRTNEEQKTSATSFRSSFHVPFVQSLDEKLTTLGIEIGSTAITPGMNFGTSGSGIVRSNRLGGGGSSTPGQNYPTQVLPLSGVGILQMSPPGSMSTSARSGVSQDDSGISRESSDASGRKSARLSSDISRRISGISNSMDQYDRSVRDVNETIQEAIRKSVTDMKKRSSSSTPRVEESVIDSAEAFLQKELRSGSKGATPKQTPRPIPGPAGDSPLSPRKMFGLDASTLLKSSSSATGSRSSTEGSESDSSVGAAKMKVSIRQNISPKSAARKRFEQNKGQHQQARPGRPKQKKRVAGKGVTDDNFRSLSPIMPTLPDKQFNTMLERREERVSRHLNTMKNELAQLNQKVEMDKRKATLAAPSASRKGIMETSYQGRPMRLMKSTPEKNVGNEFNEFLQSSGGKSGGWERKDHNAFLKMFDVWRKHPNKLMEALRKELPNKKPKEIASHIKWYERFQELSAVNKADVHKWCQEKRKENEMVYEMGAASQRAKLEGDKRRQEHLRMIREQERDKGKEKLALWKRNLSASGSVCVEQSKPSPTGERHQQQQQGGSIGGGDGDLRSIDIPKVRQHILDITAKVHALNNPRRDFRPPRPLPSGTTHATTTAAGRQGQGDWRKPTFSRSFTQIPAARTATGSAPGPGGVAGLVRRESAEQEDASYNQGGYPSRQSSATPSSSLRGRTRLPEIEPDALSRSSRPNSRPNLQSRAAEFRERDGRLTEAKKKAIEIARERRKNSFSQLTAEEIRRRIRSRTGPSTVFNPTKQSEIRKSITHLERLEMLSKQDLTQLTPGQINDSRFDPALPPLKFNPISSKGVPNWRKGAGDFV